MKGWKTWAAAGIIGGSAVLEFLGYSSYAQTVMTVGAALGLVGLGHKIEKAS